MASKKVAPYQQTRIGRRPIRAHNLLKKSSIAGQDMRNPGSTPGKYKMPTKDSTGFSQKLLTQSSAEVGPMPGKRKLAKEDAMIERDPLIQHLKIAAATPKTKGLVDQQGLLEDNAEAMPTGKPEKALAAECPEPTPEMESKGSDWKGYLDNQFSNTVKKKKGLDKEYSPSTKAVVDKATGQ